MNRPRTKSQSEAHEVLVKMIKSGQPYLLSVARKDYPMKNTWKYLEENELIIKHGQYIAVNWLKLKDCLFFVPDKVYDRLGDSWWYSYYRALSQGMTDEDAKKKANRREKIAINKRKYHKRDIAVRHENKVSKEDRLERVDTSKISLRSVLLGGSDE